MAMAALKAGAHVYLEKPITQTLATAGLGALADQYARPVIGNLAMDHNGRFGCKSLPRSDVPLLA